MLSQLLVWPELLLFCLCAGVEFRVTEEYDEDSPFSRPPQKPSSDDKSGTELPHQSSQHEASNSEPSSPRPDKDADKVPAAMTAGPLASLTKTTIDATVAELQSHQKSAATSKSDSRTGRQQIASDSPPPDSIAEGISVSSQSHDDGPESTEIMDPVRGRPGVKRILDEKGQVAPSKRSREQGPLPHPQRQTRLESDTEGSSESAQDKMEKPWWQAAADSAAEGFEGAKSAFWGQIESFTKGQGDKQATGESTIATSVCCCSNTHTHTHACCSM